MIIRIIVKCIPRGIIKPQALHLDNDATFQQVIKSVMGLLRDELTCMLEGDHVQPLCDLEAAGKDKEDEEEDEIQKAEDNWNRTEEEEYWTAALIGKVGVGGNTASGKGKSKGYGERLNCGQQGHPSRGRPNLWKLHGGVPSGSASVAACKGDAKSEGKGDWKGKWDWTGKWKRIGKTRLKLAIEGEPCAAWSGSDGTGNGDYMGYGDHSNGCSYNITSNANWNGTGLRYSTMLTQTKKPIAIGPKYFPIEMNDGDDENEEEDGGSHGERAKFTMQVYRFQKSEYCYK